MKIYLVIVSIVAFLVINVGFVLPTLVSAESTIAIAIAFVDVAVSLPILYKAGSYLKIKFNKNGEEK